MAKGYDKALNAHDNEMQAENNLLTMSSFGMAMTQRSIAAQTGTVVSDKLRFNIRCDV